MRGTASVVMTPSSTIMVGITKIWMIAAPAILSSHTYSATLWSRRRKAFLTSELLSIKLMRIFEHRDIAGFDGEGLVAKIWMFEGVDSIDTRTPVKLQKFTKQ
jgi:hypothetical protein